MSLVQKKLNRIKLIPAQAIESLRQHSVTSCKDVLNKSPLELMNILGYTYPQLQTLLTLISTATAPSEKNAFSMFQKKSGCFLPTSLHQLDSLLRGGLPIGMITEITGPPGCGKTQFSMTLSAVTALSTDFGGRGLSVGYIDTEGAFSAEGQDCTQLLEIAKCRFPTASSTEHLRTLASRVHVFTEMTCDRFLHRLGQLEETIVDKGIGILIVDSIASLARKEFDASSGRGVADRASLLSRQAARLKYIAESFEIPVVVTNQITTRMSHDQDEAEITDQSVVTAALGNSWSHCVNTRLLLQYMEGNKRTLSVSKSPLCCQESFVVNIEDKGMVLDWETTEKMSNKPMTGGGDPQAISLAVHSSGIGLL